MADLAGVGLDRGRVHTPHRTVNVVVLFAWFRRREMPNHDLPYQAYADHYEQYSTIEPDCLVFGRKQTSKKMWPICGD